MRHLKTREKFIRFFSEGPHRDKFSKAALACLTSYYIKFEEDIESELEFDLDDISSRWKEYHSFLDVAEDPIFRADTGRGMEVLYTGSSWLVNQR
jgi:hypothetical protein